MAAPEEASCLLKPSPTQEEPCISRSVGVEDLEADSKPSISSMESRHVMGMHNTVIPLSQAKNKPGHFMIT